MSRIRPMLEEIATRALAIGINCAGNMNPGITLAEAKSVCQDLPYELPQDVIELYLWRNGVRLEGQSFEMRIVPKFYFRSIEVSIETTTAFACRADDPEMQWKPSWFCLCTDLGGDCLSLETNRSEQFGRIFAVTEIAEPFPAFWSFDTMLLSILECYRAGVYFLDEDGTLAEDYEPADSIYRRFNHGLSPHYTPTS
jgi:cell wall assembly regulator SMI1